MTLIKLIFELNPTPQERPRLGYFKRGTGRNQKTYPTVYDPKNSKCFKASISALGRAQMASLGLSLIEGPLAVTINFVIRQPKTNKRPYPSCRPDLDNYIKGLLDGLNKVVFVDDGQIVDITATKRYGAVPCIIMEVKPLAETPDI